jgi:hypothetical protein
MGYTRIQGGNTSYSQAGILHRSLKGAYTIMKTSLFKTLLASNQGVTVRAFMKEPTAIHFRVEAEPVRHASAVAENRSKTPTHPLFTPHTTTGGTTLAKTFASFSAPGISLRHLKKPQAHRLFETTDIKALLPRLNRSSED